MKKSFLSTSRSQSPILAAQKMNSKAPGKVSVRELAQALPLTALIDAFSIIVIYLLIGTQAGLETPLPNNLKLPVANNSQIVDKEVAILRIHNNQFFLNEQPVSLQALEQKLVDLKNASPDKKGVELMVQADENMDYASLDPIIKSGSLAGVEKLKFAVLPTK